MDGRRSCLYGNLPVALYALSMFASRNSLANFAVRHVKVYSSRRAIGILLKFRRGDDDQMKITLYGSVSV